MNESDGDYIFTLEGEKGSSLFYHPLSVFQNEILKVSQEKIVNLLEKYEKTQDDRALAIIGALIVEEELDCFLFSWIEKYDHIKDKENLTFSFKVDLAISLNLIPVKILNAIEPIRKIRNIFAHHLDIESFEKAKEYDSRRDPKYQVFPTIHNKHDSLCNKKIEDDKEAYKDLIVCIIAGLIVYTPHVIKFKKYIWNSANLKTIVES